MPQAKSGGSRKSGSGGGSRSSGSKRSSGSSRSGGSGPRGARKSSATGSTRARSTSSTGSRSRSTSTSRSGSTRTASSSADARFEEVAKRIRKLNERIIEAGKDAGETTLSSYERALKSIASAIQRGPGSSEIEWVSGLATAQAKFIRDVTASWTSAARKVLK